MAEDPMYLFTFFTEGDDVRFKANGTTSARIEDVDGTHTFSLINEDLSIEVDITVDEDTKVPKVFFKFTKQS